VTFPYGLKNFKFSLTITIIIIDKRKRACYYNGVDRKSGIKNLNPDNTINPNQ